VLIPPGYEPHLAAVTAAPFDDLPRLAMADWLDEHGGGEWAAYIREQVAAYDWGRPEWLQAEMVMTAGPDRPASRIAHALINGPFTDKVFVSRGFPCAFGPPEVFPRWVEDFPVTFAYTGGQGRAMIAIRPNREVWVQIGGAVWKVWETNHVNLNAFMLEETQYRIPSTPIEHLDAIWDHWIDLVNYPLGRTFGYRPRSGFVPPNSFYERR